MPRRALFRKKRHRHRSQPDPWRLDRPLLWFSRDDAWTIADACEGTQIFGATGAGKSSGSGAALAKAMLAAGFGGLVLTVKTDERTAWERYCQETGRIDSLLVVSLDSEWRFDFLQYELRRGGRSAGIVSNIVDLLIEVATIDQKSSAGNSVDPYWQQTLRQLLRNAIDLLIIARETITLPLLSELIASAPTDPEQLEDDRWLDGSLCIQLIEEADAKPLEENVKHDLDACTRFFLGEYPNLASKTRSIIVSMFTSMADGLMRRPLRQLFCDGLNMAPELSHEGVIILLDLPVHEFGPAGRAAQVIFKRLWQQAVERRDVSQHQRPVFLWADESQYFVTPRDAQFQSTARSKRACTVLLTQNLPSYHNELDSAGSTAATERLLGNLQTKIFHANGCTKTNQWAEELFAKSWSFRPNTSSNNGEDRKQSTNSAGFSQSLDPNVLAQQFTSLAKGGPNSRYLVESIVFQGGRTWRATGNNHIRVTFAQR